MSSHEPLWWLAKRYVLLALLAGIPMLAFSQPGRGGLQYGMNRLIEEFGLDHVQEQSVHGILQDQMAKRRELFLEHQGQGEGGREQLREAMMGLKRVPRSVGRNSPGRRIYGQETSSGTSLRLLLGCFVSTHYVDDRATRVGTWRAQKLCLL